MHLNATDQLVDDRRRIPFGSLFSFQGTMKRSFTYSHWQRSNAPLNGKIFLNEKTSSLIWTKGAEMHTQFQAFSKKFFDKIYPFTCSHWKTPNYRVFLKNFLSDKIPLTYLELQVSMTPYFTEKMRKYFLSGCGSFIFLAPKNPFTYSHWEQPNAPPKSQKIYPFTYLELRGQNAPCFSEKRQKNLPANIGGHSQA